MDQILRMVMRMFMRKVINKGMDQAFSAMSKRPGQDVDKGQAQATVKRQKQAAKLTRRMGRF